MVCFRRLVGIGGGGKFWCDADGVCWKIYYIKDKKVHKVLEWIFKGFWRFFLFYLLKKLDKSSVTQPLYPDTLVYCKTSPGVSWKFVKKSTVLCKNMQQMFYFTNVLFYCIFHLVSKSWETLLSPFFPQLKLFSITLKSYFTYQPMHFQPPSHPPKTTKSPSERSPRVDL